jgi:hypothetical protein
MTSVDYFVKLNIPLFVYPKQQFMPTVRYNFFDKFVYYTINNPVIYAELEASLIGHTPKPTRIEYLEMNNTDFIPLHKDHGGLQCTINHYYETHDADTVFYTCDSDDKAYSLNPMDSEVTQYHGQNVLYKKEDCKEVARFTARDGETYLLNTRQIHSVELPQAQPRRFIAYHWDEHDYETIKLAVSKLII